MATLAGLKYATSHEWVSLEGATARVGITDFAVAEVKDIVYVDLPAVGAVLKAQESFGALETVKAAFDLYAPVSGTVKSVNAELTQKPEIVTEDPYVRGWMVEIEVGDASQAQRELNSLMDATAYEQHCRSQQKH